MEKMPNLSYSNFWQKTKVCFTSNNVNPKFNDWFVDTCDNTCRNLSTAKLAPEIYTNGFLVSMLFSLQMHTGKLVPIIIVGTMHMISFLSNLCTHGLRTPKSKISEKLGRCGRQNMLRPYLKIWDWD